MATRLFILMVTLALAIACTQEQPDATATAPEPTAAERTDTAPPQPVVLEGFSTPESVLYDAEQDVYFVSNINGAPLGEDGNGYISRINAETRQIEPKWIDGARIEQRRMNAPKGMTIVGDELWVADITVIHKFDRRTGEPKGRFIVEGTNFLNDLTSDGTSAYVSDSGLRGEGSELKPTGIYSIWKLDGVKSTRVARGKELNSPNGLAFHDGKLFAVTFGAAEVFPVESGRKGTPTTLPAGTLDGLVALPDGSLLVSSWDANAVFRGTPGGSFAPVIQNVTAPADIGYDSKRQLVVIPHFTENRVSFHPLR